MVAIRFPTSTAPGARPAEGGGRLINAFAEPLSGGGPGDFAIRRSPGLQLLFSITAGEFRGGLEVSGAFYAVIADRAYYVTTPGGGVFAITDIGEIQGEGPVSLSRNNKAPTPDVVCVSTQAVYLLTPTNVSELSDPDLPSPIDVTFVDGYLMFGIGDGRVFASKLNETTINALDFTRADARADRLLRVIAFRGELFVMKSSSIQPYYNAGNPEGFPFSPRQPIPRGLAGPWAVAGYEPGWTNELIWVGDDNAVYIMEGYSPRPISTPDLERLIKAVPDKTTLRAFVYRIGGSAFWALSSPTWTWEFNILTGYWNERRSFGQDRWKATNATFVFGEWVTIVGDEGAAFVITEAAQTEGSDPLIYEVWSAQGPSFPNRMAIPAAAFAFTVGQGFAPGDVPIETAPRVSISWSDDGGVTWSSPLLRELGAQGRYRQQVKIHRTGLTGVQGRMWRLKVSDPVYVALLGGDMQPIGRAS